MKRSLLTMALVLLGTSISKAVVGGPVPPIVAPGGVVFGSAYQTLTSTPVVSIDTATAVLRVKNINIYGSCTGAGCGGGSGSVPFVAYDSSTYQINITTRAVITGPLWAQGSIRSSSTFITTADGHLDASTLTNPLPFISGSLLYSLNPDSLAGRATNFLAYNVNTASATISSTLILSGVSESTPLYVQSGNMAFAYGNGIVVSPDASWPSGTHNLVKVFYNGFDDETDWYQAGTSSPNPLMSFRSTGPRIGIRTNVPAHTFDVNGDFGAKDSYTTYGVNATTGSFTGGLTVNSGSSASTGIYVVDGNVAFNYGKSITVSPTASWPSGTHNLMSVYFNGSDDEVDFFTPGALRSTPVMSLRSNTGRVGIKQQTPLYDLDVNGNGAYISTGSAHTLYVVANGTYGTSSGSSGGAFIDCSGGGSGSGMCTQIYSSAGAQNALDALLYVRNDNTAWNEPLLYLHGAYSTPQSTIRIQTGWPTVTYIDITQSLASASKFQESVHGGTYRIEGRNTADNAFDSAIIISSMSSYGDVSVGQGYNPAQIAQLQVIASTGNVYAFYVATTTVGGNSVAVTTGGVFQTNGGDAFMQETFGNLISNVTSSTGSYTVGQYAIFSSTNGHLIGGTGGAGSSTSGQVVYNNAGALAGIPGSVVTASSVTFGLATHTSSLTVIVGGGISGNVDAALNVYVNGDTPGVTRLGNFGSLQHTDQFYGLDKTYWYSEYGFKSSDLNWGNSTSGVTRIASVQSVNQFLDIYSSGKMILQTAAFPVNDIVLQTNGGTVVMDVSTNSVLMVGTPNSKWATRISSTTTGIMPYMIGFTTMGVVSVSSNTPNLSSCGTGPSVSGNSYSFRITGGTGATGCIATFAPGSYKNAPSCVVDQETMSVVNGLTHTQTASAITISQTGLGTGSLNVICHGQNE